MAVTVDAQLETFHFFLEKCSCGSIVPQGSEVVLPLTNMDSDDSFTS